jgi:hypothetical protein
MISHMAFIGSRRNRAIALRVPAPATLMAIQSSALPSRRQPFKPLMLSPETISDCGLRINNYRSGLAET